MYYQNIFVQENQIFYFIILNTELNIQLFAILLSKNFHICQTMLDTGNKKHKIEFSGRGKGTSDNTKGALMEEYLRQAKGECLS